MVLQQLKRLVGLGGPLSARQIAKSGQLAANSFAQPDVRMREMQRLLDDGQPAALAGVLKRFAVNAQGHIADEEEKRWLEGALSERGEPAKAALARYIEREDRLTHALATYLAIAGAAQATAFFVSVLAAIGPLDHRRVEAKRQLLLALAGSLGEPAVQATLATHLEDHADDVAIAALELVERACRENTVAAPQQALLQKPLTHLVTGPDVSARLALRAADVWANAPQPWLRLPTGQGPQALGPALAAQFAVVNGQLVRAS